MVVIHYHSYSNYQIHVLIHIIIIIIIWYWFFLFFIFMLTSSSFSLSSSSPLPLLFLGATLLAVHRFQNYSQCSTSSLEGVTFIPYSDKKSKVIPKNNMVTSNQRAWFFGVLATYGKESRQRCWTHPSQIVYVDSKHVFDAVLGNKIMCFFVKKVDKIQTLLNK